jgi:hypothetical protein
MSMMALKASKDEMQVISLSHSVRELKWNKTNYQKYVVLYSILLLQEVLEVLRGTVPYRAS